MQQKFNFWHARTKPIILAIVLAPIFLVLALWLPFGFRETGLLEEWGLLGLYSMHGPIFFIHPAALLMQHALRPLMVFPLSLAFTLDPNSFDYWHLFTMFSLIVKGMAMAYLIFITTESYFWGALAGVLMLLWPADTMQVSLRPLQINCAVAGVLLGSALIVSAYQTKRFLSSFVSALLAPLLFLSSIFMYEATLAMTLLPLMMLGTRNGFNKTFQQCKHRPGVILSWFAPIAIYIVYSLIISQKINSYQEQLTSGKNPLTILDYTWKKLFSIGLFRGLIGGWYDAIRITLKEFAPLGYLYLSVITFLIFSLLLYFTKHEKTTDALRLIRTCKLGIVGIITLCLGYAPFLFSPPHLEISQRTFLFVAPGATIAWIALLIILTYVSKILTRLFILILIFIGFSAQLFQFHHYAQLSEIQRGLVKNIVENFDGNLDNKTLLILDGSNRLNRTWMFLSGYLEETLTYFYNKPIKPVQVCSEQTKEWRSESRPFQMGKCIENANNWVFNAVNKNPYDTSKNSISPEIINIVIPKNKVALLKINPDGSISTNSVLSNYRNHLQQSNDVTAIRYRKILNPPDYFFNSRSFWRKHTESYKWSFGDWWSMEIPIRGSHWSEANWSVHYFHQYASAWKTGKNAILLFELSPLKRPYLLKAKYAYIDNKLQQQVSVRINGKIVPIEWISTNKFLGNIPPTVLINGINVIEFNTNIHGEYPLLSEKLHQVEISPTIKQSIKEVYA